MCGFDYQLNTSISALLSTTCAEAFNSAEGREFVLSCSIMKRAQSLELSDLSIHSGADSTTKLTLLTTICAWFLRVLASVACSFSLTAVSGHKDWIQEPVSPRRHVTPRLHSLWPLPAVKLKLQATDARRYQPWPLSQPPNPFILQPASIPCPSHCFPLRHSAAACHWPCLL